jgi:hypothetical protein
MKVDWQLESKWWDKIWACIPLIMCLFMVWSGGEKATADAASWPDAFPKKGVDGVPESVGQNDHCRG